jgi:hypothetical protein
MNSTRLMATVCGFAMLAAVPALAQYNAAHPGADSERSTDMTQSAPSTGHRNGAAGSMQGEHNTMMQDEHRQSMRGRGQDDTSQNAEVDRLNEQSLQAAQQGRAFNGSGRGSPDQDMQGQPAQPMPQQGPQGSNGGKM